MGSWPPASHDLLAHNVMRENHTTDPPNHTRPIVNNTMHKIVFRKNGARLSPARRGIPCPLCCLRLDSLTTKQCGLMHHQWARPV